MHFLSSKFQHLKIFGNFLILFRVHSINLDEFIIQIVDRNPFLLCIFFDDGRLQSMNKVV